MGIGAFASFLVVLRASLTEDGKDDFDETGINPYDEQDGVSYPDYDDRSSFHFLLTYVVEVVSQVNSPGTIEVLRELTPQIFRFLF